MIDALKQWLLEERQALQNRSVNCELSESPVGTGRDSMSATLATEVAEAQIQLWETGECDVDKVRYYADQEVQVMVYAFKDKSELRQMLDELKSWILDDGKGPLSDLST